MSNSISFFWPIPVDNIQENNHGHQVLTLHFFIYSHGSIVQKLYIWSVWSIKIFIYRITRYLRDIPSRNMIVKVYFVKDVSNNQIFGINVS